MAFPDTKNSVVSAGLTVQQWDDKFFREYLTSNRFSESMGTDESAIVQIKENLTKAPGDSITFALVNRLKGAAVTGRNVMMGNEDDLTSRSFKLKVDKRRNAVRVAEVDEQFSAISLRQAAKPVLMDWSIKDTENQLINALGSCTSGVAWKDGNATQRNAWTANNVDRVLFGDKISNYNATFLTALQSVTTAAGKITAQSISKMKAIAETKADPLIRPIRSTANKGRRYYIAYLHPALMQDLKRDTTITQAQREVRLEMENERLFEGGDLYWDGVIIKQVEQANTAWNLGTIGGASNTANGVYTGFLCGAQALGIGYARRWKTTTEQFDYGDKHGIEISSIYGVDKLVFGTDTYANGETAKPKDNGVVTGFFAATGLE